jgi:methyl-accepting chemotaxis protein
MLWFKADAPIRLKLLIAFSSFVVLVACTAIAGLILKGTALIGAGVAATLIAVGLGYTYREMIAVPYVTTVVRMEALAAGDLESPIEFTNFRDCVGRMTKAMGTFQENARVQIALNVEASRNADVVNRMAQNFKQVAEGNLTVDITEDYPAIYEDLKANFNIALASLRDLIRSVAQGASRIQIGSGEIAQASEDLARRTESTAASLEETSAAIHQMDNRLKDTAQGATRSVVTSEQALSALDHGRHKTDTAVQAMERVSDSAKGIDSVIEGLDKIAFQTRVLAMNAAVEAGRAGDAGRGFAVVADLVSALAMRAEEEAKRARNQLTVTQVDIGAAVDAVQLVDQALSGIVASGREAADISRQIATDNQAQALAITEVSAAVGSMDQATQKNAAMVEQTSAAARQLAQEVQLLAQHAQRFVVDGGGVWQAAPASAAQAATGGRDHYTLASDTRRLPASAITALTRPSW